MSTPAVTITGNMKLLTGGNDAGSVVFCLVNYGNVVPRIVGTTVIVQTSVTAQADASGNFSIVLWGNDVIIPAGAYYELDFRSDTGVTVQKVPYSFTGSGSFDISTQTPLIPPSNHPTPTNGLFTATSAGLTPASGGGTTNFLRADGTFAAPPATGGFTAFTPVSHQFLTGVNVSGVFSAAQPAAADLSNGTTGTGGAVVLATAAALTDPVVNTLNVTGNSALSVSGTGGQIAGGFASPSVIRHYLGDGTGWRIEFAKRAASVDTLEAWITDGGVFNIVTGIQINGAAASGNVLRGNGTNFIPAVLAAADLSNGTTGSGSIVLATSPTLVTPALGVATATSINKVTLTAPATGSTLTIVNGKTLAASNSLTLAGTDGTTITFQASDTYVGRATTDAFTNKTLDTAATGNVLKINGTQVSAVTGTGSVVLSDSATLTGTVSAAAISASGDITCFRLFEDVGNANVTPVTVTGTVSQTILQSVTTAAGDLNTVGRWITVRARGFNSSGTTGGTITYTLKVGTHTLLTFGAFTLPANLASNAWYFETDIMVQTAGATGALEVQGNGQLNNVSTAAFFNSATITGIDLTAALTFALFSTATQTTTSTTSRLMGYQGNN